MDKKRSMDSGFVVGATASNSGKTIITLSIVASLINKGYTVQTFKVGPDFIDPTHLTIVSKRPCINLDLFMMGQSECKKAFIKYSSNCDFSIIEGVMGLFDGMSKNSSTADVAKLLGLPVLLIVNASGLGESIIPKILGFLGFDSDLKIKWMIFNKISSKRHENIIKTCERYLPNSVKILGYIPKNNIMTLPSRHLGLYLGSEITYDTSFLSTLTNMINNHIDLDILVNEIIKPVEATNINDDITTINKCSWKKEEIKVLVARDDAFCFYYHENLSLMMEHGATIEFFSPLKDEEIPLSADLIIFGGGYPELFTHELGKNSKLKDLLRKLILRKQVYVYAECGGLIYLARGILVDGKHYEMLGILPITIELSKERKVLAYREVELINDCILGKRGTTARGHEFHYSHIIKTDLEPNLYRMMDHDKGEILEGFCYGNVVASYVHLHFSSNRDIAKNLVASCAKNKISR